jgi:hypothetical protein
MKLPITYVVYYSKSWKSKNKIIGELEIYNKVFFLNSFKTIDSQKSFWVIPQPI